MAAEQMADGSEEQRRAAPAGPAPTAPAVVPQAAPAAAPQTSP
ncbi:Lrp/AsnC family transcriptional regulator, partial [Streptomyces sp. SID724]|nr:Lrp/AsnC family transcriptional regulator [Streptomyces sp. SID724]